MANSILGNGALVTLGIVGVVAAVGAANKAGLYGSRASSSFAAHPFGWAQVKGSHVVKVSDAERKPTGIGWGAVASSGTRIGDVAYLDGGDVYLSHRMGKDSEEGSMAHTDTHGSRASSSSFHLPRTYAVAIEDQPDGWDVSAKSLKEAVTEAVKHVFANEADPVGTRFHIRRSDQSRHEKQTYEVTESGHARRLGMGE